ncbi:FHA domain-containing protein [Parvibacter caecicola]|uniref:FHA domain-containing protein n=1 Tax=Parvibacter caecicola TaxID=747645 RepID=UPI0023F40507|nr:FHA domain-containing protein [Parvibacter caecicola]
MTPTDVTPASVLFDLMKRECGVSHKELAGMLLSGRPLSDGRSPLSRMEDRTWVSRVVVHAAPASLADRYFCDYSVGALRLAARMKSRERKALTSEKILSIVTGRPGEAMDRALEAHGEDPTLFRNMMERIKGETVLVADEKAEVALVLLVAVACTSDVRRAVGEAQSFAKSVFGRGVRTPAPALARVGGAAAGAAFDDKELWLGLLRVEDGYLSGAPQWVAPTEDGTEIGSLALAEGAVNEVGPDVSARHARIWRSGEGQWLVEGLESRNGTVLTSGVSGEETVVEPPQEQRFRFRSAPVPIAPGDTLALGQSTLFVVVEGYPE